MIDPSLLKYLSDEAQTELRNWENLFAGKGWAQLKGVLEQHFEMAKNAAINSSTWEDNRMAIGSMDAIKHVFNMAEIVEQQYTGIALQQKEAEEEKAEDEEQEYE